jgi:hypothetical protein
MLLLGKDRKLVLMAIGSAIETETRAMAGLARTEPAGVIMEAVRKRQQLVGDYEALRARLIDQEIGGRKRERI